MNILLSRRGSGMVMSLMIMAVLSILAVTTYRLARVQILESVYQMRLAQASAIAETGLEDALRRLYLDSSWRTGFASKAYAGGRYTVTVSTGNPPVIASTGYSAPIAFLGPAVKSVAAQARFEQTCTPDAGSSAGAGFAIDGLADAYDSAVDPNPAAFTGGAGVWSNGSVTPAPGGTRLRGRACYFSGAPPDPATVTEGVAQSTYTVVLPFHDGSAYFAANDNPAIINLALLVYNPVTKDLWIPPLLTGTLNPGTYYFHNLTVDGTLVANTAGGTVTVYVSGALTSNGPINNVSRIPSRLLIYGQNPTATYALASAAPLHAYLEARNADVSVSGPFYGKLVCASCAIAAGGTLHYDKQFGSAGPIHVAWEMGTWSAGYRRQ